VYKRQVISASVSEPDNGLYHAMNKGMSMASGDYYWFINSGDEIYLPSTLDRIFNPNNAPFYDVYYGDTVMIDADGYEIGGRRLKPPHSLSWKDFKNGMLVSHQSIIVHRNVASHYNEKYLFSADFEWCLLALQRADRVVNTHQVLSRFLDGGITKQNILAGLRERYEIMQQHFGTLSTIGRHFIIGWRFLAFLIRNKRF
jgi:glycosyltransferase involved in cell wall biosynthesis